ncbi:MAG: 1-phosphofructokinase family hexose kinase [Hyphomicrobiaceae bacterium]
MNQRILTVTLNPAVDISARADEIRPGVKVRCSSATFEPGGGGINVARVIAELGGEAAAFLVTGGVTGSWLTELVADAGIRVITHPVDGMTRPSFHVADRSTGELFRFVLPGPEHAPQQTESIIEAIESSIVKLKCGYVVLSGSMPPGIPDDLVRRLASVCRRLGVRLAIDTSGSALLSMTGAGVFLLKPDRQELDELRSSRGWGGLSIEKSAHELLADGTTEIVVVTLGGDGALLVSKQIELRLPALEVEKCSPVGAGDSFVAGMVYTLSKGRPIEEAFRFGMAAGSAAVMTPGTELAKRADVERLYARMTSN